MDIRVRLLIYRLMSEIQVEEIDVNGILSFCEEIQGELVPDDRSRVQFWMKEIQTAWFGDHGIASLAKKRQQQLKDHAKQLNKDTQETESLIHDLQRTEDTLVSRQSERLPDDLSTMKAYVNEARVSMITWQEVDSVAT